MKDTNFEELRYLFKWGTKGINGDEPLRTVRLKDIEYDHLVNIIIWVKKHNSSYTGDTLSILEKEFEYRLKISRKEKLEKLNNNESRR